MRQTIQRLYGLAKTEIRRDPVAFLLIFGAYAFVFLVAMRPGVSWIHPEIQLIDNFIKHSGGNWYDLIFNWEHLEFAPRHTRPLSSLIQVIDAKIRLKLPSYFYLYSQSWSVTWIFSVILNPLLFYRLLRGHVENRSICVIATAIYLLSPTSLSAISLFFRPAKVLAQFFLLLSLHISAGMSKRDATPFSAYIKLGLTIFLGLISDEAGWFAVPAVLTFHLLFHRKSLLLVALSLIAPSALALLTYLVILPRLSSTIWGNQAVLGDYFILKPILESTDPFNTLSALTVECLQGMRVHCLVFIRDTFALFPFNGHRSLSWHLLYLAWSGLLAGWLILSLVKAPSSQRQPRRSISWATTCVILGIGFHSVLMTIAGNKVFGPYYYGGYITPFLILIYAILSDSTLHFRGSLPKLPYAYFSVSSAVLCILLSHTFIATNIMIKNVHFYPPGSTSYRQAFSNSIDRFTTTEVFENQQKRYIASLSALAGGCIDLPVELLWHATRLGAVNGNGAGFPPGDRTMRICR